MQASVATYRRTTAKDLFRMTRPLHAGRGVRNRALTAILIGASLLGACGAGVAQGPGMQAPPVSAAPSDLASLVASRRPAVVDISTLRIGRDESDSDAHYLDTEPESDFAGQIGAALAASVRISQIRDLASGLILSSDGLILTSAHVVAGIDEAQVRLDDGRRFPARLVGIDRQTDVALLRIAADGLPVAVIGDSSQIAPGDWVAAISAPFGFQGSVTTGVVSAKDRFIPGTGRIPFIQTDVAINPGSSGSPLFNARGEVVAINSMIYSATGGYMGLSFAVPINLAMEVAAQLRATGTVRRARLGVELQEMTPGLAQSFGVPRAAGALVVRVDADSPAERAGLASGDVVAAIDGTPLSHFAELQQQIAARAPGTRSRLDIWRRGSMRTVWATLSEQPSAAAPMPDAPEPAWNDGLGLLLGELPPMQRRQMQLDGGLLVREATGAARSEGIRAGDLVVAINEQALEHVDDFRQAISRLPAGHTVALLVMRERRLAYVPVRVPPRAPDPQPAR